jgi:hypothetical protein
MNGDPVYRSNDTFAFMGHYLGDMRRWLCDGGILVVESQGAALGALQKPYDRITEMFDGSHVSVSPEGWVMGSEVVIHPSAVDHPLARGMLTGGIALNQSGLWARRRWFPRRLARGDQHSLRFLRKHHRLMYRGWFLNWSEDWVPIVVPIKDGTAAENAAVLLYRPVEDASGSRTDQRDHGAVVLTTLFIASSELTRLVSNIFDLTDHS